MKRLRRVQRKSRKEGYKEVAEREERIKSLFLGRERGMKRKIQRKKSPNLLQMNRPRQIQNMDQLLSFLKVSKIRNFLLNYVLT